MNSNPGPFCCEATLVTTVPPLSDTKRYLLWCTEEDGNVCCKQGKPEAFQWLVSVTVIYSSENACVCVCVETAITRDSTTNSRSRSSLMKHSSDFQTLKKAVSHGFNWKHTGIVAAWDSESVEVKALTCGTIFLTSVLWKLVWKCKAMNTTIMNNGVPPKIKRKNRILWFQLQKKVK